MITTGFMLITMEPLFIILTQSTHLLRLLSRNYLLAPVARSLALAVGMHAKIVIFSFITFVPYLHPLLRLILSMANTNSSSMLNLNKVHMFPEQNGTFFVKIYASTNLNASIFFGILFSSPEFHIFFS